TPGVVGLVTDRCATNGFANRRVGAFGADQVFGANRASFAFLRAGGDLQGDLDGVFVVCIDRLRDELVTVVWLQSGWGTLGEFGEVVQHAGLVHNQVLEFRDAGGVIQGA